MPSSRITEKCPRYKDRQIVLRKQTVFSLVSTLYKVHCGSQTVAFLYYALWIRRTLRQDCSPVPRKINTAALLTVWGVGGGGGGGAPRSARRPAKARFFMICLSYPEDKSATIHTAANWLLTNSTRSAIWWRPYIKRTNKDVPRFFYTYVCVSPWRHFSN